MERAELCTGWRVRDVVAHVFSYDPLSTPELVRRFLAARLIGDRVNALGAAYTAGLTDAQLLRRAAAWLREELGRAGHAGVQHDEDAHALPVLLDVMADGMDGLDSGRAVAGGRVVPGAARRADRAVVTSSTGR